MSLYSQVFKAALTAAVLISFVSIATVVAIARDHGQYAQVDPKIKLWFDQLESKKGLCCSFADGYSITNVDWEVAGDSYRVRVPMSADGGEMIWVKVPKEAVITIPNIVGKTMVWPMYGTDGLSIRCFLPGSMT